MKFQISYSKTKNAPEKVYGINVVDRSQIQTQII